MLNRYSVIPIAVILLFFGIEGKQILDQNKLIDRLKDQSSEGCLAPGTHIAGMHVVIKQQRRDQTGAHYLVSISVDHNRTFTMPIYFSLSGKWADIDPQAAQPLIEDWVKNQAIGVASHGVIDTSGHAYLVLPIPETRH